MSRWQFEYYGRSNASISHSTIGEVFTDEDSMANLESTTCQIADADSSSTMVIADSFITMNEYGWGLSKTWLINSIYNYLVISDFAEVYVAWYLDVKVIDSVGHAVPSADVTASFSNATVAESESTGIDGWARLTLMEKMMNNTGNYTCGNYIVNATYGTNSNSSAVSITGNQQITLALNFIVPEFPSLLVPPLFMIATILAAIVCRKKHLS